MDLLNYDIQNEILRFLTDQDLLNLFNSCENAKVMMKELATQVRFKIDCDYIILKDKEIEMLKAYNIPFQLWEYCDYDAWDFTYYLNGKIHRDNDEPAMMFEDGTARWYQHGLTHRDNDKPAYITNTIEYWYQYGKLHRDNDKPALIDEYGNHEWYQHGKLHRDNDMPALIGKCERKWYHHGKLHRDNDMPAHIIYDKDGKEYKQYWFRDGILCRTKTH
jgi:hypothetical protein